MNKEQKELFNKITLNQDYGDVQKRFIIMGLEKGLDVSWYAKPEFNEWQMFQIRLGLENNIDVSILSLIHI